MSARAAAASEGASDESRGLLALGAARRLIPLVGLASAGTPREAGPAHLLRAQHHPARSEASKEEPKKIIPSRSSPMTDLAREDDLSVRLSVRT